MLEQKSVEEIQQKILEGLNKNQKEAVETVGGTNLVIAGAGSGKTAVLTRRCAYLISEGVKPGNILCVTFTNKAAAEMNSRVRVLLNDVGINLPRVSPWEIDYINIPLLCTFHSLGVRVLREFGEKVGLNNTFTILDMDDQKKLVRRIVKGLNLDTKQYLPKGIIYFISQCKQERLAAIDSKKIASDFPDAFHHVYKKYEQELEKSHIVDFDDLLFKLYVLLRDNEDIRNILQKRWSHIMVDEFQDTNQVQFEIIRLLYPR